MNQEIYHRMAQVEDRHWWFTGRRRIVGSFIAELLPGGRAAIFEAGCGTGGNLGMLAGYGKVCAMECDGTALEYAVSRDAAEVGWGRLPDQLPFPGREFDLIVLLDVLEHLEADVAALSALGDRLAPGGALLVTVPACRFLWSRHDELHHHYRRYSRGDLKAAIAAAGLLPERLTYFNSILFPAVCLGRVVAKIGKSEGAPGLDVPPAIVNAFLTRLFSAERFLLRRMSLPFGVSLLAVLRKRP